MSAVYAYASKALKQFLEVLATALSMPAKKGKAATMTDEILSNAVSRISGRQLEPLFSWLDEKTGIQTASKIRSRQGLPVHAYGKLAAALLLMTSIFNS